MSVTATLNGSIFLTDSVSNTIQMQKAFVALAFTGTVSELSQSQSVGTSPTTLTLPASPTQFLYIKNLAPTNTLTVTWTPNGGASNPVITLQPGSSIIFMEVATGGGITALSVTASGASTPIEYMLLG